MLTVRKMRHSIAFLLVVAAMFLTTVPLFFDIYRHAAFNTAPRDDYAPYLLALVGQTGEPPLRQPGTFAGAPFGYRILSVAAAIPFYYLLPTYAFSNLDQPDLAYLRATQALAMVSYLSMLLTAVFVYRIARVRLGASVVSSLLAAVLALGLFGFLAVTGVDALAVLVISMLIYYIRNRWVFVPLMIVSAGINEKILIIIATMMLARLVFARWNYPGVTRTKLAVWLLVCPLSLGAYLGMRALLRLSGDAHRTDVSLWLPKAVSTVTATLSLKGLVANVLPMAVLAIVIALAFWTSERYVRAPHYFQRSDIACFFALTALALIINAQWTAGRLIMHSFPIYLPLVACFFDAELDQQRVLARKTQPSTDNGGDGQEAGRPAASPRSRLAARVRQRVQGADSCER